MNHICPKCNVLMTKANLDSAGPFFVYKNSDKKVGFFGAKKEDLSSMNPFVCPECGLVELYVEEPEKFK
ncbi:MAG: hypothetical protein AB6733_08095 [Clostridiaceae bacterium]